MSNHCEKLYKKCRLSASQNIHKDGIGADLKDIEELLSKPREDIIHDMELLIRDALDNGSVYEKLLYSQEEGFIVEEGFVSTLLLVLGEIESENSLPLLFDALQQEDELIDMLLISDTTELIYDALIGMGKNQIDKIDLFTRDPKTSVWARTIIGEAMVQLALNIPKYRTEVINMFSSQARFYIDKHKLLTIDEFRYLGFIFWDLIDLGVKDCLPLIKEASILNLIDEGLIGNQDEIENSIKEMEKTNSSSIKTDIMPLVARQAWYWEMINKQVADMVSDDDPDIFWEEEEEEEAFAMDALINLDLDEGNEESSEYSQTKYEHLKISKKDKPGRNDPN
jgi:hypothetical protein